MTGECTRNYFSSDPSTVVFGYYYALSCCLWWWTYLHKKSTQRILLFLAAFVIREFILRKKNKNHSKWRCFPCCHTSPCHCTLAVSVCTQISVSRLVGLKHNQRAIAPSDQHAQTRWAVSSHVLKCPNTACTLFFDDMAVYWHVWCMPCQYTVKDRKQFSCQTDLIKPNQLKYNYHSKKTKQ